MEWIDVNKALPMNGDTVLALMGGEVVVLERREESPTYEETFNSFNYWIEPQNEILLPEEEDVTHWMPLPDKPKAI